MFWAKARRTINQSKRKFWKNSVSNLTMPTPINKHWNTIRKIIGKGTAVKYKHGHFPLSCQPGKDNTDPNKYRPIALIS